jgi:hypothetical protein
MTYPVNQSALPGIEDTIRAKLQEINQRNGTNYWAPPAQLGNSRDYTSTDPGAPEAGTNALEEWSPQGGTSMLAANAPDPEQFRKNVEDLMKAMCRKDGESCVDFNKRLRETCIKKFGANPTSITACRLLADIRAEPCLVSNGTDRTDMCEE